ncbi:MAG: hypothetical protein NC910_02185 [Candidatus Omnitrophica bacterium]|nr:hypothetical protein [Candidatus Omnitrophota bacterium]
MEKPQAAKVSSEKIGLELSRTAEKRWQLSGTIRGGHGKPIALLNNSVVAEGETIGGMKVVQVREDEVDLEADGRIETVEIR